MERLAGHRLVPILAILATFLFWIGQLGAIRADAAPPEPAAFAPYLVRPAPASGLIPLSGAGAPGLAEADAASRRAVEAVLGDLASAGLAGDSWFDPAEAAFRADLSPAAVDRLRARADVASVEPAGDPALPVVGDPGSGLAAAADAIPPTASSVVFVQVHSPFIWGRVSTSGLTVELTLEDAAGQVKGVSYQSTQSPPNDRIKIDRSQLYFETTFVDPNAPGQPALIRPGDRVRVRTAGTDPVTRRPIAEDKRVVVDDLRVWTSYERDTVEGESTAPPGSTVVATVGSALSLSQYLTPGGAVTYAESSGFAGGSFSLKSFRTSADPALRSVDLRQGTTGFVRLIHPDGNEVYALHGQNVLVLERSPIVHGYAFSLPGPPNGLELGVTVKRPKPRVEVTLRNGQAQVKDTVAPGSQPGESQTPYFARFSTPILAGDVVEVSINGAPPTRVDAAPLSGAIDLAAQQVSGRGPASTSLVVAIGRVNGYISENTTFDYLDRRVTSDVSGHYRSGSFTCGSGVAVTLRPGTFGYVGFEDARGSFVYLAFAAPTTHVMVDYPFLEGWLADGLDQPVVTVRAPDGTVTHRGAAVPLLLYAVNQRVIIDTYYQVTTSRFIAPGDTVTVEVGDRTATIPVDRLTAYLDTDGDAVVGSAPPGARVRVVPGAPRTAQREAVAGSDGAYAAGNPLTLTNSLSCAETKFDKDFVPGEAGRAYLRHADGNEVFAGYGRSIHVNLQENYLEIYSYPLQDQDWEPTPRRPVTTTLAPRDGDPITVGALAEFGRPGKTKVTFNDARGGRVLIRAGDTLTATFEEGPPGLTRPVSLVLGPLPLVTGSPDMESDTVAGVGPRSWGGQARLTSQPDARGSTIAPSGSTAYPPVRLMTASGKPLSLEVGYAGTVSFSDRLGRRLWAAWAVTAEPVKIDPPIPGATQVCGTAAPGSAVRVEDATDEGKLATIGTGTAGPDRRFCVAVSPPLIRGQVLLAEAAGTYSQPVVVDLSQVFFPTLARLAAVTGW